MPLGRIICLLDLLRFDIASGSDLISEHLFLDQNSISKNLPVQPWIIDHMASALGSTVSCL